MRAGWRAAAGMLGLLVCPQAAMPQTAQEARRIEEKARAALAPTELDILKKEQRLVVDYGLWINHLYSDFTDDDNESVRSDATDKTYAFDRRFWLRATWRPPPDAAKPHEHSLYLRLKDKETWRDPADANGRHDWDGPHVDYLFLTLDVNPVWVQAGRRFYQVGQGIAYSNVHDGVELLVSGAVWSLMGFVSRTLPHESNVDLSVPGGKKSGRMFYGVEGKYLGIPNHGVYGYVLFQRDDNDEDPDDLTRDYDYQSEYFGLGSEGKLLENLRYAAEFILETGDSLTSAAPQQTGDITAWAMDASVTYDVQLPMQPTLYAEYAFGSGDSDRSNVTDTVGGNAAGTDTSFLYFGYLPTGYALSPRLSNLRMFKVGMALKPLERIPMFKELSCSVDFYRYMKEESAGGVFDLDATDADKDLGYEVDLTLNWQLLSDLALAVEYGRFEPGDAYPRATNDAAEYFAVSITSTF